MLHQYQQLHLLHPVLSSGAQRRRQRLVYCYHHQQHHCLLLLAVVSAQRRAAVCAARSRQCPNPSHPVREGGMRYVGIQATIETIINGAKQLSVCD
jgi:hypothetical protein